MIDLGLTRINQLVRLLQYPFPWRAIHVAGTNGKGSVCAYISTTLSASRLLTGRFTSPHLLDRWDCISIDNAPIARGVFLSAESHIQKLNAEHGIGATEFEILTATAFEVFTREKVHVAVVEVGMGGRGDATNVLVDPMVVVLTKVGLDHEGYLGGTLAEIAWQKAGIVKRGVPVVVDGTNEKEVLEVVERVAREVRAGEVTKVIPSSEEAGTGKATVTVTVTTKELGQISSTPSLQGDYQLTNSALAIHALALASKTFPQITAETISTGISTTTWPGRLDFVDISPLLFLPPTISKQKKILLDGAHNPQAAAALAKYVDTLRPRRGGVNWVLAATQGKDISRILRLLLKKGDRVFAVPFGPVDGMPWVRCMPPAEIVQQSQEVLGERGGVGGGNERGGGKDGGRGRKLVSDFLSFLLLAVWFGVRGGG
ncbi:FolC bifunctional protein [Terfezia boudieri ATCC MYA-4762]|uniref:Dihydrofolate synthetase n=1 Tax=Terfezia boudieri ATCC MYA-4762 TaxID=1051890 RepID=A0A3N4M083_9PEZI|nr:FolC bifunctional protein [Terfezia boudieri ATCC MYA-4762]